MDQLYRTSDGKFLYLPAKSDDLTTLQRRDLGLTPNGFPKGVPMNRSPETILAAYGYKLKVSVV